MPLIQIISLAFKKLLIKIEFYFLILRNLAFIATMTVLKDMNIAPIAGVIKIPSEINVPAASGIANTLYPVAQIRF